MDFRGGLFGWIAVAATLPVLLLAPAVGGGGTEAIPGPIPARVLEVIDGDTILVRARIWLGQEVEIRVRLQGVDTPELGGACEHERALARRARDFVRHQIGGGEVVLRDIQYGKYAGRVVARMSTAEGRDITTALLEAGLGRPYDGGRRSSWCDGGESRNPPR